jgi:S1-C subfamily serine protease
VTDTKKPTSDEPAADSAVPTEVARKNVEAIVRPVEDAEDPETKPIVMTPELPSSPLAVAKDDKVPMAPEVQTKPFELLPAREAGAIEGVPTTKAEDDGTKPLSLPTRAPAAVDGVTVELIEQNTGVLIPADANTKPLTLPTRTPAPADPITVELVEENTGVLSPAADKPAAPVAKPAPAEPAAKPITVELVEETSGALTTFDDTKADKPSTPLSTATASDKASTASDKASTNDKADTTAASPTPRRPSEIALADMLATNGTSTGAAVDADDIEETTTSTDDTTGKSDEDMVPWVAPDDGFQLADEIGSAPAPLVPNPPILPSPEQAALEAARIVSQMVDIESESGAVIAAAAAAGAAIEAAKQAQKATIDPRSSQPSMRIPPELTAAQASGTDPITTVRLSRDRILAALADEDIAVPVPPASSQSRMPAAGASQPRMRARTEPGVDEDAYEEFDPVAIAAAAIGRLRQRARTDLAELRVHYHRHDILVLMLALVIIVIAGRVHRNIVTPPTHPFSDRGLTFVHPTSLLRPEPVAPIAPRILRDPTGAAKKDETLYHVELSAVGSTAKLEVVIDKKPSWSNIVTGLELDRRSRWGELYTLDDSSVRSIAGHDWLRTSYRYAHAVDKGDVPRVDQAVEYATIDREQIYVITIFGTALELEQLEDVVSPSLRVPSQTGLPLVPQTSRLSQRKYPGPVGRAFDSTVMVVVADLVDGRLRARGGGSGVIVGGDGSILTNYHVIHDKEGRLHDVFVIGRFSAADRAPQLQCAGRPSRSKLLRDLDLALIKCDMDLDGRTWSPTSSGVWATLPEARAADVKIGQRLWVLGYPDVGGGGLRLDVGEVEGWTGEDGAQGKDFIKTDASITHGNSGGPVIDDKGRLVGVASAFRTRITANGGVIETSQVGLVRPLQSASNLLAYAVAGWTPREGYTDVELTPSAVEAAAEGIRIFTTILDDANEQAVANATVMVLKPGINTSAIDMNRLDDQAIAWGKTNALGEVRLKQLVPVPGTYTVMVVAPGYEPLIGENELRLDANTPPSFDPWGKIGLRSR